MFFIIIAMLVIVVVAGLVVTFVAFPHRGEEVPGAPWLGDAMTQAADALPTIADGELDHPETGPGTHAETGPETGPEPQHKL